MTCLKNIFLILLSLSLNICAISSHVKASTSEKDDQSYQVFLKLKEKFEDKFNQNAKAEKARQKLLRQEEGNTKQQLLEGMSRFLRQTQQACMKGSSLEQLSCMVNQQYQNLQSVYCRNGVVPPNFPKKLTLRTKLVPLPFKKYRHSNSIFSL
ncbi:MAG: hypothetical protein ACRYGR_10770 [Janthinobacterium lividum]